MMTEALRQVIERLERLDSNTQDLFAAYIRQKLPTEPLPQPTEQLLATFSYSRDDPDVRGRAVLVYPSFIATPNEYIWRSAIKRVRQANQEAPLTLGYDGRTDLVLELDTGRRVTLRYLGYEEGKQLASMLGQS